ncbi:MAG: ChaN family lipoprotein [Bacteroidota bacterium]
MRVLVLFLAFAAGAIAQPYRAYTATGDSVSVEAVAEAMTEAEVVFLGEQHDDAVAHALQFRLLRAVDSLAQAQGRPLVLALEMFERDVQGVLDEYLAGLVRERDFLAAARPWGNYETDYRPLVEYARERGLPVVASNAPHRYVSRTSRLGSESLDVLSAEAKATLPALPVAPASAALDAEFTAVMQGMMGHGSAHTPPADSAGSDSTKAPAASVAAPVHGGAMAMPTMANMLAAQNLRDVSMAGAIADALDADSSALVVHVNGTFHSEGGLGIPEHLARLRPGTRVLLVTMKPRDTFPAFDPTAFRTDGTGFVVVTDPAGQ